MSRPTPLAVTQAPIRIAVLDADSGFVQVLSNRLESSGWQHRRARLARSRSTRWSPCGSTRVVIDLTVLGPAAWTYLEKLCARLPQLGVVVCTGQSTVAQRVRGLRLGRRRLGDQAVPPGGGHRPRGGGRAAAQARRRARTRRAPVVAGELEIRADQFQAFVGGRAAPTSRAASSSSSSCWPTPRGRCSSARRSTSACGATRWSTATARSTSSCASCARSSSGVSPGWRYIHTHFGIGYRFAPEPVDPRARGRGGGGRACRPRRAGGRARRAASTGARAPDPPALARRSSRLAADYRRCRGA